MIYRVIETHEHAAEFRTIMETTDLLVAAQRVEDLREDGDGTFIYDLCYDDGRYVTRGEVRRAREAAAKAKARIVKEEDEGAWEREMARSVAACERGKVVRRGR